jgi:hypothetical protein
MKFCLKNKKYILAFLVGLVFFIFYSFLSWSQVFDSSVSIDKVSMRYNTPDEVVSSFFVEHYQETGNIFYLEPLNNVLENSIFPRWARPFDGLIALGAFQGLVLFFGFFAKIFGSSVVPFLTPFFAVVAALFFYLLVHKFFGEKIGQVAAFLLLIFPGFWYYAARPLFHNILFLTAFLAGLYFLFVFLDADKKCKKYLTSILFGLSWGLALVTRTSEFFWIFVSFLIIVFFNWSKIKSRWPYLFLSLAFFLACFVPVFYNNQVAYGDALSFGYDQRVAENVESGEVNKINFLEAIVLPFGFHPRVMLNHVFDKYLWQNFYPWFILIFGGLLAFWKRNFFKNKKQLQFLVLGTFVFGWLFVYYGSWFFDDSLGLGVTSLGSSYIRYFLPAYIFGVLFSAILLVSVTTFLKRKGKVWSARLGLGLVLTLISLSSLVHVYLAGPESLVAVRNNLLEYRKQASQVIDLTEENNIFLVDVSNDKILFPERKRVIVPQGGQELELVKKVLPFETVWFFYRSSDVATDYLNEIKFAPHGLEIYDKMKIDGGAVLFRVREIQKK